MHKHFKILNDCRGFKSEDIFDIILKQREIDDINEFLYPSENNLLPLDSLLNIDKAYELIIKHMNHKNIIGILWDTDTDGIASGTIMTRYLKNFIDNDNIKCFINEGKAHGLIDQDIDKFIGLDLLIIVDSLDKDISQYKKLTESGIEIIVLDHHVVNKEITYDEYITLITSQINYENPQLSGSGVVWKFCKYIDEQELTEYADDLVDLAACGLIGDMMDMSVMENRFIVNQGLNNLINPAIKKILSGYEFNSTAIAFSIAPLINAANRMFENESAMKLFLADDNKDVLKYKKELISCKEAQNEEVARIMPLIMEQSENQTNKTMIVTQIETPYGISGLIGNKLLEIYKKPILVLKDCKNKFSGSMRAVGIDDFRKICNESKLAEANGHELASGIEIVKDNFNKFIDYIDAELSDIEFTEQDTLVDIQINIEDITRELVEKIKLIDRISGTSFKPIRFYISNIKQYEISNFSNYKHLVIKPQDNIYVIEWNTDKNFEEMEDHSLCEDRISCICTLDNGFFGRNFVLKAICDEIWTEDE
jgi:single-stranded-DNA-specific exonuclease